MNDTSLQDTAWPHGTCYGCGPANPKGLQLKSFPSGDVLVATWTPGPHHLAFPGILNGGIIGTLLDCHSNITAWWALSNRDGLQDVATLTLEYNVKLLKPTPVDAPVDLVARPLEVRERSVRVEAELSSGGVTTATCTGVFVRPRS